MAVIFYAADYAYGVNPSVEQAIVQSGPTATGAGTVIVNKSNVTLYLGRQAAVFNTNAPITIGTGTLQETVTPSAVSTNQQPGGQALITATFANLHGQGDRILSGTAGLQEALNDCSTRAGGGVVYVDGKWTQFGGTSAMIAAATLPTGVTIIDIRGAAGTITNPTALTTNGAIPVTSSAAYSITKAGVLADTLAATATDGITITITSATANAHTITATGLYVGAAGVNLATFAAYVGATMTVRSSGSHWLVVSSVGVTFS